ncbi:MAG: DUF721 domain-containing protein, partial [Kordiimonadaceae bacterium]|nr:DUF721 domain-containing protein [Kordiimonadaceae bacterium]
TNRTYRTKSIADIAGSINNRTFARFGFAKSDIILHWGEIVGSVLARSSLPERLIMPKSNEKTDRAGVLHIRVEGSFAPEMQHLEPLVIDRINSYYGFKAVERLIFKHGNVDKKAPEQKYQPPILSDSQRNELDLMLKDIKDDQLRASLFNVGAELAASQKTQKPKQIKRFTRRGQGSAN